MKTLHPSIHAGILAERSLPSHLADLAAHDIAAIDLVACNLYPFGAQPSIETIDIGGPAMVRAAAKNHADVTVVVHPEEYGLVLDELRKEGAVSAATRRRLARDAFAHTAAYDAAIVGWIDDTGTSDDDVAGGFPTSLHLALERGMVLRYGENPHQRAARYRTLGDPPGWWDGAVQHGGRELSYLNLLDAEAAWTLVHELAGPNGLRLARDLAAAVIVKHTNPCGVAVSEDLGAAHARALEGDPVSAFGGILALSGPVTEALAEQIVDGPLVDVLVAPAIDDGALARFAAKRRNMRVDRRAPAASAPARPSPGGRGLSRTGARPDRVCSRGLAGGDQARPHRRAVARSRACLESLCPDVVERGGLGLRWAGGRNRMWAAEPSGRGGDRRPQGRRTSAGGSGGE